MSDAPYFGRTHCAGCGRPWRAHFMAYPPTAAGWVVLTSVVDGKVYAEGCAPRTILARIRAAFRKP